MRLSDHVSEHFTTVHGYRAMRPVNTPIMPSSTRNLLGAVFNCNFSNYYSFTLLGIPLIGSFPVRTGILHEAVKHGLNNHYQSLNPCHYPGTFWLQIKDERRQYAVFEMMGKLYSHLRGRLC